MAELSLWLPGDDLLLKNAVEAGASLEALARGAVRFSRRYSVAELRERWCSLLYDPEVPIKASEVMVTYELVNYNGSGIGETSGDRRARKRKTQSICKRYYAMRKRFCSQVFDSFDMAMIIDNNDDDDAMGVGGFGEIDANLNSNMNSMPVNNSLVVYGNSLGVESSHSMNENPIRETIDGISTPPMPVQVSIIKENGGSKARGVITPHASKVKGGSMLNGPDAETKLAMPSGLSAQLEVSSSPSLGSSGGDPGFTSDSGKDVLMPAAVQCFQPELLEDHVLCGLNTEDPDIPSNNTGRAHTEVPHFGTQRSISIVKEVGYPDSSINSRRRNKPGGRSRNENFPSHSLTALRTVPSGFMPNISPNSSPVGNVMRAENPARNSISALSRQSGNAIANISPSYSRLVHATTMYASSDGRVKQEEIDVPASVDVDAHPDAEERLALPDFEPNLLNPEQEGGGDDSDDGDNYDNENEIPYFSDVEAMILEMDLCSSDPDTNASKEVSVYQLEETMRTVMRLEQCAQSIEHRAIASHGALAVLYGRNMKQYIKKSEVILGRAADGFQVDIDLGREGGRANKISRRQAIIKLDANGSFVIKNLGKFSIFVNGKEVVPGKLWGLRSNCLIQIRGFSFIFEFNNKCVKSFMANMNVNETREG